MYILYAEIIHGYKGEFYSKIYFDVQDVYQTHTCVKWKKQFIRILKYAHNYDFQIN